MPSGHKLSDLPSRYQPLFDVLTQATGDEVTLTFKEIAAMIGSPLPEYAILHTNWWRDTRNDHVQAWRALGWCARVIETTSTSASRAMSRSSDVDRARGPVGQHVILQESAGRDARIARERAKGATR